MLALITGLSAILAGMGIGGGSIFVLLTTSFLGVNQKEAQALNLILFIAVSFSATIANFKNKNIDFKIMNKVLPLMMLGCYLGTVFFRKVNGYVLRKYFLYFLVIIGIYEIITSLKNIKSAKDNSNKSRKE